MNLNARTLRIYKSSTKHRRYEPPKSKFWVHLKPEVLRKGLTMIWFNGHFPKEFSTYFLLTFTFEKSSTLRYCNYSWQNFSFDKKIVPYIPLKSYLHQRRGKGAPARLFWRCGTSLLFLPHLSSICLIRVVAKRLWFFSKANTKITV